MTSKLYFFKERLGSLFLFVLSKDNEPIFKTLDVAMKFYSYSECLSFIQQYNLKKNSIEVISMSYDEYYFEIFKVMKKFIDLIDEKYREIDELCGEDYDYCELGNHIIDLDVIIRRAINDIILRQ